MKKMFVVVFLIVVVSVMAAQPFGVRMGNTIMNLVMLGCNPTLLDGESYINDDETNKKAIRHMVATLFLDKEMNIAVYDVDLLAQGINEFGLNSWRGDQFYYDIKKAIDEKEAKDEKEAREAREAINN